MKPRGSFVIPVHNGQAYIVEAINSCLYQTIKDIEVIVVDDGSTDNTNGFVLSMVSREPRVRLLTLKENVGRSMARNHGIAEAKADVLFMMDADDVSAQKRVALTLAHFKKHPKDDILTGGFMYMHEIGTVLGPAEAKKFDWETVKATGLAYTGHSTMAFRRKVFDKVQYTDGDYSKHGIDDWKFQVDSHRAGFHFGWTDKILAFYRVIEKPRDEEKIKELKGLCLN